MDVSSHLFSPGLDLAGLAASADLLPRAWTLISELRDDPGREGGSSAPSVDFRVSQAGNYKAIAFVASPLRATSDLVPSWNFPDFRFLCTKNNPHFNVNEAAKALFDSAQADLSSLKAQVLDDAKSMSYLIVGHSMGGSIASLFTLWLLNEINPTTHKRPLCITFGSPLLGDIEFRHAIYRTWNSCFLHVVRRDDPDPVIFPMPDYRPFGTYLFLSESGKACFEASDSIMEVLMRMNPGTTLEQLQETDYGPIVKRHSSNIICKDAVDLRGRLLDSYKAGIMAQLSSIGLLQNEHGDSWVDAKIMKPEKEANEASREMFDPALKLNEVKVNMAQLEWYKKINAFENWAYYDSFKVKRGRRDHEVVRYTSILINYWERMVDEVEKKPQMEESHMRKRWLFGGTNFRRMVEPLEIAEYYSVKGREPGKDYWNDGRRNCFKKLEKWHREAPKPDFDFSSKKKDVKSSLTEDSCFWAHVEEALIAIEAYKREYEGSLKRLKEFEGYVFGLIERYAVSPEIFIKDCTYMKWWNEYEGILAMKPGSDDSKLVQFMRERWYNEYTEGRYDP